MMTQPDENNLLVLSYLLTNQTKITFPLIENIRDHSNTLLICLYIPNTIAAKNNEFIFLRIPILNNNIWHG